MIARVLILLIRAYQLTISPLLGNVCRFEPSCSRYALQCLQMHGALKGSWLALRRLLRCHPFHPGGYDPPPLPAHDPRSSVTPTARSDDRGQPRSTNVGLTDRAKHKPSTDDGSDVAREGVTANRGRDLDRPTAAG